MYLIIFLSFINYLKIIINKLLLFIFHILNLPDLKFKKFIKKIIIFYPNQLRQVYFVY